VETAVLGGEDKYGREGEGDTSRLLREKWLGVHRIEETREIGLERSGDEELKEASPDVGEEGSEAEKECEGRESEC